jgi:hypothetical protein
MMKRCYDPSDPAFPNYGGRGITVCDRWHVLNNFIADTEPTFVPGLHMDRINNDGNYEPGNLQWVTQGENNGNRRSLRKLTFDGKTQSVAKWAKETGIAYGTLWERVAIWEWDAERALTTPALTAEERMAVARASRKY